MIWLRRRAKERERESGRVREAEQVECSGEETPTCKTLSNLLLSLVRLCCVPGGCRVWVWMVAKESGKRRGERRKKRASDCFCSF
jgi:hypothetical protein